MAKKKIPQFETLDEAVAFWETHSFADYVDDTEPVEIQIDLPPKRERVEKKKRHPPDFGLCQVFDGSDCVAREIVVPTLITRPFR